MPTSPSRFPTPLLFAFGLVNLPLSMLMSPTAAVLPNFYLEYSAVTLAGLATATLRRARVRWADGSSDRLFLGPLGASQAVDDRRCAARGRGSLVSLQPRRATPASRTCSSRTCVITLGWTLVEIPHTAMAAELSGDYHERSRIALWRQMLGFVGGVLFMASPMLLAGAGKFTPEVMRVIATFHHAGLPLQCCCCAVQCPSQPDACSRGPSAVARPVSGPRRDAASALFPSHAGAVRAGHGRRRRACS